MRNKRLLQEAYICGDYFKKKRPKKFKKYKKILKINNFLIKN